MKKMIYSSTGHLYLTGYTRGNLGGTSKSSSLPDGYIIKLNASTGDLDNQFGDDDGIDNDGIRQINISDTSLREDILVDIMLYQNDLIVVGTSSGGLGTIPVVSVDPIVIKLDSISGKLNSTFGDGDNIDNDGIRNINIGSHSIFSESITATAVDQDGNIYISGYTTGNLGGDNPKPELNDGFVIKLNGESGELDLSFGNGDGRDNDGIKQLNSNNATENDYFRKMLINANNELVVSGITYSSLGGSHAGSSDIFMTKMNLQTGLLITAFGSGDGTDNDGIYQVNHASKNLGDLQRFSKNDLIEAMILDTENNLYLAGSSSSSIGAPKKNHINNNYEGFVIKMNAATGKLDPNFGDGDGKDNDGITQFKDDAEKYGEYVQSIDLDSKGNLFVSGLIKTSNGGNLKPFITKIDSKEGRVDKNFNDTGKNELFYKKIYTDTLGSNFDSTIMKAKITIDDSDFIFLATSDIVQISPNTIIQGVVYKLESSSGNLVSTFGTGGSIELNDNSQVYLSNIIYDNDNIYIAGQTKGTLGTTNSTNSLFDAFIAKINPNSGQLDTSFGGHDGVANDGVMQISETGPASNEYVTSLKIFNQNIFLTGYTSGDLGGTNAGNTDGFVIKLNKSSGQPDTQFGNNGIKQLNYISASGNDRVNDVSMDDNNNLFLVGETSSTLRGTNSGSYDGFIIKLNSQTGEEKLDFPQSNGGILQLNSEYVKDPSRTDRLKSILIDNTGNLYSSGSTFGDLGEKNAGGYDIFTLKIDEAQL